MSAHSEPRLTASATARYSPGVVPAKPMANDLTHEEHLPSKPSLTLAGPFPTALKASDKQPETAGRHHHFKDWMLHSAAASAVHFEAWRLAWNALRTNKLRTILTMAGIVVGSCCMVAVVTVALTGKRYILAQIEGVGSNLVYAELRRAGPSDALVTSDQVTLADVEAIRRAVPQAVQAAGTRDIPGTLAFDSVQLPVKIVGVTEGFQQIRNLVILRGRYFDSDDLTSRNKLCLVTDDLAHAISPREDVVGKLVRVGEIYLTVIGVFRERVATFGQSEITSLSALVPFHLIRDYATDEYVATLYAQADRTEDVPLVTERVDEVLRSRHRAGAAYEVQNLTTLLDAARSIAMALSLVLVLVALISLAISGVGIMNIMLVTVTERTHEIGIRRAVGARRDAILFQFLFEALLISGLGALAGILIAVSIHALLSVLISFFPEIGPVDIPISWVSVLLAFTTACSTGAIFGYLPAKRAADLRPTDSLRYE